MNLVLYSGTVLDDLSLSYGFYCQYLFVSTDWVQCPGGP